MDYASQDTSHRKLVGNFYKDVEMPGLWKHNLPDTLKMIDLYYNSQYKTGRYDPQGFRKFFYNIVKPACDIATKFIDLDTSNITLQPEMGGNELRIFLMQHRLKQWLKEQNFGKDLNDMTSLWPIYGHLVMKKLGKKWVLVPIQNLRVDPSSKLLKNMGCFSELYLMSTNDLRQMKGWKKDELYARGEEDQYLIYDCFDQTDTGWHRTVKGDLWCHKKGDGMVRSVETELNRQSEEWSGSIVLFEEDIKDIDSRYREIKWEDVAGRWLGRGYVEYLEDNQVARNETENLERKGLALSSLKLWQTRDEMVGGQNVLVNAKNGQIIKVEQEITPISMEERNLAQYKETRQNWDMNTERKTFTSDITTGASLPSRTPLGVANQQAMMASSFFERKREELGLFIKAMLLDEIIPSFKADTMKEHVLIFSTSDEDTEYLDNAITETMIGEKVVDYAMKTGFYPSNEQKQGIRMQVKDKLKGQKNRYLKIPDSFWANAKYYVDIDITGESVDTGVRAQVLQMLLQILGTNPGVTQNPATRSILFKLAMMGGINPAELNMTPSSQDQAPAAPPSVAGSMSVPGPIHGNYNVTQKL
jgi:hypothetical protein